MPIRRTRQKKNIPTPVMRDAVTKKIELYENTHIVVWARGDAARAAAAARSSYARLNRHLELRSDVLLCALKQALRALLLRGARDRS